MNTAEFATARCRMAPMDSIAAIELTELHGLLTDPQVRHYLCDDQVIGLDRVQSIIEGSITHFRESGLGLWTVSDGVTAERAGIVGFAEFSAPGALELMYAFYPHFWGRGLATETARAVMQRAFTAGLRAIRASTDEPNQASIAILQRLGFRKIGRQEATPPRQSGHSCILWPTRHALPVTVSEHCKFGQPGEVPASQTAPRATDGTRTLPNSVTRRYPKRARLGEKPRKRIL